MKCRQFLKVTCIRSHDLRHYATNARAPLFLLFSLLCLLNLFFIPPRIAQSLPDTQTETDTVTKTDEIEVWNRQDFPHDYYMHESWEAEVEDLVAWTNTLDTDTLED